MSAATIKALVLARDPSVEDNAGLDALITAASGQLSAGVFGTAYDLAVALMVLHWVAKSANLKGGEGGGLTSEKEGDLARSFTNRSKQVEDDLDETVYGTELKRMIRIYGAMVNVTRAASYVGCY